MLSNIQRTDHALFAHDRNVLIARWDGPPTMQDLDILERQIRTLTPVYEGKTASINVVRSGTPNFSSEIRARSGQLYALSPNALGAAQVLLIEGLAGVAVRAFFSTTTLASRSSVPNKVFGNSAEAATWLAGRLALGPEPWTASSVLAVIEEMLALT